LLRYSFLNAGFSPFFRIDQNLSVRLDLPRKKEFSEATEGQPLRKAGNCLRIRVANLPKVATLAEYINFVFAKDEA
jgi:hypothetical protein